MKKSKLLLLIGLVMVFASVGCRSLPPAVRTLETHDTVTVEKTITITDTVFKTESSKVVIELPCDTIFKADFKPVSKQVKNARLTIQERQGKLSVECFCDTIALKAQLRNELSKESRNTTIKEFASPGKEPTAWYIRFLTWSGGIGWLLLLIYLTIKTLLK